MDIVRFKGGLGNQMFQYAFMEELRSRGRDVYGSIGGYGIDRGAESDRPFLLDRVFPNVNLKLIEEKKFDEINNKWKIIKEDPEQLRLFLDKSNSKDRFFYATDDSFYFDEGVFKLNNCVYVGYWQNVNYFDLAKEKIRKCFQFRNDNIELQKYGESIKNYIAVHVRRGDYLLEDLMQVCDVDYYKRAMKIIREKDRTAEFLFFSDDIEWVQKNLKGSRINYFHKENFSNYEDWYDMYLMSKCKGNIISNSTFSWWGAWLNDETNKVVISPQNWVKIYALQQVKSIEGPYEQQKNWITI